MFAEQTCLPSIVLCCVRRKAQALQHRCWCAHWMAPVSVPKPKRLMTSMVSHSSAWSMSMLASGPSCSSTAISSAHAALVVPKAALHHEGWKGTSGECSVDNTLAHAWLLFRQILMRA